MGIPKLARSQLFRQACVKSNTDCTLRIEIFPESWWRRQWQPTPVLLPGKSHGWRSLVGCSPWGRWGSDTSERLHFNFSLSCIGEGNGNPLQCSCLENPRDGACRWAAVCGVAESDTTEVTAGAAAARELVVHTKYWVCSRDDAFKALKEVCPFCWLPSSLFYFYFLQLWCH